MVALSPSSLTFPSVSVGSSSPSQTVTLTNTGNTALNINGIQIAGDYTQSNNCPVSLSAGSSCAINAIFTPSGNGVRNGAVTVSDDVAGSPQIVGLTGTGVTLAAVIALTPSSLTFPSVSVGSSSPYQTVTLTNTGNAALNINGIQIAGDYTQINNCPVSLSAGSRCAINVIFTPSGNGVRNGTVTISDSVAGSPQIVGLTGTGVTRRPPLP